MTSATYNDSRHLLNPTQQTSNLNEAPMTTTFKTILFTTLCFFLGACGASLQNQSTLATPATNAGIPLPRTDSVEARNLYASALDCYEQQHRATAEMRVADRCNVLRTYGPRGDDTSQLAEVISCFSRNDHASPNCVRYVDTTNQPPALPRQPVQTQVTQGQEQRPAQQPQSDPRMAAMDPEALLLAQQLGQRRGREVRFCANDQVLPGGEVNDRMIFANLPFPGARSLVPNMQAQTVNGTGIVTINIAPTPYAYRFMLESSSGEQMYVFSGLIDLNGRYRIQRGGQVVHTNDGDCLAPLLMPNVGERTINFLFTPGVERHISITAYTAAVGRIAQPVSTCVWPITAGTLTDRIFNLRPEFFAPRLSADGRVQLGPSCGTM